MGNKILIQPRVFHVAMDYSNMELFDRLIEEVDETRMPNNEKLCILRRFHYRYGNQEKLTVERYSHAIDRLKPNLNRTIYCQTLLTNLVNQSESEKVSKFIEYLLSRPDVKVNQADRNTGFPALQSMFCNLWNNDTVNVKRVKRLLDAGAKWNIVKKKNKRNVLQEMVMEASYSNSFDLHLQYLLFNTDIDMDHKDKDGKTVLDLSVERIQAEKDLYEKRKNDKSSFYHYEPTEDDINKAMQVHELIASRIIGGI